MAKQIHITISDKAAEELKELKEKLNLNSTAEVIRSSVALKKFLQMEKESGNDIILRNRKSKNEKVIVMLNNN